MRTAIRAATSTSPKVSIVSSQRSKDETSANPSSAKTANPTPRTSSASPASRISHTHHGGTVKTAVTASTTVRMTRLIASKTAPPAWTSQRMNAST